MNTQIKQLTISLLLMILFGTVFTIYCLVGIQFAHYFGSIYSSFNPLYIFAAPYRFLMESSGMKSVALIGTLYFAWLFITDGLFAKRVMKVAFYPVILLFQIVSGALKWLFRKLFQKNQPPSKFMMVLRAFKRFESHYYEMGQIWNSLRTFFEFSPYIAFPPLLSLYPASGPWRARKETLFKDRNLYDEVATIIKKQIGENAYLSDFRREGMGILFLLHASGLTGKQLEERVKGIIGEICRKLPGYNPKVEKFASEILVERDAISVSIERQPMFADRINANLSQIMSDIKEGHMLLGFGPGEFPEVVSVPFSKPLHSATVSQSGGGKDVQTLGILASLLDEKARGMKLSLHLFDTKGSDWSVFGSREKHSIFRYVRGNDGNGGGTFAEKLEALVADMRDKSERIGKYGSVERYDTEHSGNPIGFTYVVLNEALSLFSNESSSETKRIASALVSLLCEGRACGYRIHLLSQSLRADSLSGSSSFGKILTNVDTIYAGRVSNKTEASIVGRQLDSSERSRLVTLPKHSFLMIQEGKVQSIFKPYYVDQLMMEGFLDKHFPKVIVPSEEELEITGLRNELSSFLKDPKIFSYLMDSDASGEYRWRIGREAGISEPIWRKVGVILKKLGYVELQKQGTVIKFIKPLSPDIIARESKIS